MFDKIIGYEGIKKELEVMVDILNDDYRYRKIGAKRPSGLLLVGLPGLGKTLMATEFIDALYDRDKLIIRKDRNDNEFLDYLKTSVEAVTRKGKAIILFDDIDKYANDDLQHSNSKEFVTIQTLIDECKDKDVFFIATANDIKNIPHSLTRPGRLETIINVDTPKVNDAKEIIKHYLKDKKIDNDVDYEELARILEGKTIAALEKVINDAAINAAFNSKERISRADIINAILRVIYNAPKGAEEKEGDELMLASHHEAGHVLVSELLDRGSVNLASVANYYSDAGGITSITMPDDYWSNLEQMENRVRILLAGKAAVEFFMNSKVDLGASFDLFRAHRIVERIVKEYAVNGFRLYQDKTDPSERLKEEAEIEVRRLLDKYYTETIKLLEQNPIRFVEIVKQFLDYKTITQKEITFVFENYNDKNHVSRFKNE